MKAGTYGIKNLQRIVPRLIHWTYEPNEGYKNLRQLYTGVVSQYNFYLGHVITYIGGVYETQKTAEQIGPVFSPVPPSLQHEAMQFLATQVLQTPTWLVDTVLLSRTGQSPEQIITDSQHMVLNNILSNSTLNKISEGEAMYGVKAYRLIDFLDELDNAMWTELASYNSISIYRRNLQRYYVERLLELANPKSGWDTRDVGPVVRSKLAEISMRIDKALTKTKDAMTVYHLRYLKQKIQ